MHYNSAINSEHNVSISTISDEPSVSYFISSSIDMPPPPPSAANAVSLSVNSFGVVREPISGKEDVVWEYVWTNVDRKTTVKVISYGAIITSIQVPDKHGNVSDIVMGFDSLEEYFNPQNPYFGAIVGRVANRIANGEFDVNGQHYSVAKNVAQRHHLHGGLIGFDKFNWIGHVEGTVLVLTHTNPDSHEGYPGDVMTQIRYQLTSGNHFKMGITSTVSKATPVNLTNHSYFNLAGHETGSPELLKHWLTINADKITETDSDSIPTGKLLSVAGTPFDFRVHREIGPEIAKLPNGFDDNFCLTLASEQTTAFVARVTHPTSGRYLEIYSDQPGVQLYTSNYLPKAGERPLIGKGGASYEKQGSLCLEFQKFPDAVHHSNFPSIIVKPGEISRVNCVYKFGVHE